MQTRLKVFCQEWGFKAILPVFLICFVQPPADASIQPVSQLGASFAPPAGGNGSSGLPIVSADGRYVLFASTANNLVLTNNNNSVLPQRMNVFLRDRNSGTTALASANLTGTGGGNGDSFPTGISTNGQFVLFESAASDLVANDTNLANDIFVRDLVNGVTTLVSGSTSGGSANGASYHSVMTPDGRYVAFVSAASNLVAGDTNLIPDVFVRDLQAGTTWLASVGAQSTNAATLTGISESPEITPDGRHVVFYSTATNLVPGVGTAGEIYVCDLQSGNTLWVSTNARAIFQSVTGSTNAASCNYSISDDGQFVAYEVCTNMPTGTTPAAGIILRYHVSTGSTDLIATNANVPVLSPELIHNLAMTPDGRFVAFVADVSDLSGTNTAIYLWDAQTGTNTPVSTDLSNSAMPANGICDSPVVSSNGQWVAFISSATDLATNASATGFHAYLCNVPTGAVRLLDTDTNGFGGGINPSTVPALSADGSIVAFESANLLNDNRQLNYDVFTYTTALNATDLISAHYPALPSQTPDGITGFTSFSVSSNGQFVAFYSDADDLVPNDTNATSDVFVRALIPGTNILASVNTNGVAGDSPSTDPAISGDGRYVAFTSSADDLVPGDANKAQDVFIRDLQAGTTALASVSTDGVDPGNGDSYSPVVSADGRYVLFHSKASNLAAGSFGGVENLFFRDLQTATTYALTSGGVYATAMTPDGHWVAFIGSAPGIPGTAVYVWNSQMAALIYTNTVSVTYSPYTPPLVSLSPDGQTLAYMAGASVMTVNLAANTATTVNSSGNSAHAGLQISGDGRFLVYSAATSPTLQSVYLYDLQGGTNLLVSQSFNGTSTASSNSDSPAISPGGRFIAYRSLATNLIPDDTNPIANLFIYDTSNNATILVSVNASGSSTADDRSLQPVFSADGRTLFFQSWASDLSSNDFNNGSDLFALDLTALPITSSSGGSTNSASVFYAQLFPAGSFASNPTISWLLASGKTYQVQYKNDLDDAFWQNLPGSITFIGDTGYVTDPTPPTDKRFYRIVLSP